MQHNDIILKFLADSYYAYIVLNYLIASVPGTLPIHPNAMTRQQHHIARYGKFFLLTGICLFLFAVMFYIRARMERNLQIFHQINLDLANYQKAGQLLRQGSDILTDAAREYTITMNRSNRDEYFQEANTDKHREQGLEILDRLPGGEEVKKNLEIAMEYSMELMDLEYHAMRLIAKEEELASPDCPEPIATYDLPLKESQASEAERQSKAQALLFGKEYKNDKTRINFFIDRSFTQATDALAKRFTDTVESQKRLYILLGFDMLVLLLVILILLYFLHAQRTRANVLLRKLLDNMPALFYVKNARTETYIDANAAFLQFAGKRTMEEILGQTDQAIFDQHTAKNLTDNDAKTLISRGPITLQDTLTDVAGRQHRFRITQFVVDDSSGIRCVIGMATDITASEEVSANAEAIAKLLYCLQDDVTEVAPSQLLEIIRTRTDSDYALLVRYDQEGRCIIEKGCSIDRQHAPLNQPVSCLTSDIPQILREIQRQRCYSFSEEDLSVLRAACVKYGQGKTALPKCATMIAFPIFVHHELWGNLTLAFSVPHDTNKYEREFVQECCEVLALSVERQINYQRLQAALQAANGAK